MYSQNWSLPVGPNPDRYATFENIFSEDYWVFQYVEVPLLEELKESGEWICHGSRIQSQLHHLQKCYVNVLIPTTKAINPTSLT